MMENYLGDMMINKTNDMVKHMDLKMNQMDYNMTQNNEQIFGYIKAINTKPKQTSHCEGHLGG
jgi:NifU-like protein involved in Fe-S cluster formation